MEKRHEYGLEPKHFYQVVYLLAFALWLWIFYNTPYLNDDWYWGTDFGPSALISGGTNSRYMGNLIIVMLTRNETFKTFFCAGVVWLFSYGISMVYSGTQPRRRIELFLFANVALLMMSSFIWREIIGWMAGFANYFTAAVCFIWIYIFIKKLFSEEIEFNNIRAAVLFMFMFLSMLFVEHMALFFFGISFVVLIVSLSLSLN